MLQFALGTAVPDLADRAMIEQGIDMPVSAFGRAQVSTQPCFETTRAKGRTHIQVPATVQAHEVQRTDCN